MKLYETSKRGRILIWYVTAGLYVWGLFKLWIETIFVIPIKTIDMLWLLVPVWITWFFAEFYQEKLGTSIGNGITNAVLIIWGSIDCSRQTVKLITNKIITAQIEIIGRFAIIAGIFIYGILIVFFGIKGNKIIKKIGRVRVVTYIFAMFVPIFYNVIPFSVNHIIAALLFFPLFYFVIELVDRITPNPKAITQDNEVTGNSSNPKAVQTQTASSQPNLQNYALHHIYHPYQGYYQHPGQQDWNNRFNKK